jgi:hypothetical protein
MNKHTAYASRILALLVSLAAFGAAARAQSSLVFSDSAGRKVEFTNFGTIVYPNQNHVSRGIEVIYNDGIGVKRAWYLNSQYNSGIIPVSLSADQPNGHRLRAGQVVYVRARMRTADNRLEFTCRYILKDGAAGIEAVVTVENTSTSSINIGSLSILNLLRDPECQCPCEDDVREFDGASVQSFVVTVAPNLRVRKTRAVFASPTLNRSESRDLPGCTPGADVPLGEN